MARNYERLSTLDASFLALETRTTHFHVAGVSIFDAGPLQTEAGGVDIARIRRFIESKLQYIPRYRQRLAWVPVERYPVWVDDEFFNLDYHVRHTSLPQPGTDEQLKRLTGRIISQQLDRSKPLWEVWVVEGLEGNRLALISKIHHAMIDGIAGTGIMTILLNVAPTSEIENLEPWTPNPPPNDAELVAGEITRRIVDGFERVRSARRAVEDTRQFLMDGIRKARAVYYSLSSGWLTPAPETPINQPIGPNRRFDWIDTPLATIKEIRQALGGTVNDVILAMVAGGLRKFFTEQRDFPDLDIDFRVMAPVSVRGANPASELGNQVAMWLVQMPLAEPDPVKRLEHIKQETLRLKMTEQALGAQTLVRASGGAPHTLIALGARLATSMKPFNLTVTNVPGPQFPMYMLEARLLAQYGVVPLWYRHGVGIALFSYNGTIGWGFNADWDVVPDVDVLARCVDEAREELVQVARAVAASQEATGSKKPSTATRRSSPAEVGASKSRTPSKSSTAKSSTAKSSTAKSSTAKSGARKTSRGSAAAKSNSRTASKSARSAARPAADNEAPTGPAAKAGDEKGTAGKPTPRRSPGAAARETDD